MKIVLFYNRQPISRKAFISDPIAPTLFFNNSYLCLSLIVTTGSFLKCLILCKKLTLGPHVSATNGSSTLGWSVLSASLFLVMRFLHAELVTHSFLHHKTDSKETKKGLPEMEHTHTSHLSGK
eukprot:Lithocolla_globosa_v1_NODE_1181_length_2804_cov_32.701346.p5 type:complete len:123 gc:universal NODE_1181_length_2804_cov_32.701346:2189-1821(-)